MQVVLDEFFCVLCSAAAALMGGGFYACYLRCTWGIHGVSRECPVSAIDGLMWAGAGAGASAVVTLLCLALLCCVFVFVLEALALHAYVTALSLPDRKLPCRDRTVVLLDLDVLIDRGQMDEI